MWTTGNGLKYNIPYRILTISLHRCLCSFHIGIWFKLWNLDRMFVSYYAIFFSVGWHRQVRLFVSGTWRQVRRYRDYMLKTAHKRRYCVEPWVCFELPCHAPLYPHFTTSLRRESGQPSRISVALAMSSSVLVVFVLKSRFFKMFLPFY
jgi:hypothetical protein